MDENNASSECAAGYWLPLYGKNVLNHDGKLDVGIFVRVWIVEVCGSIIQKEMTRGLFRTFRIDSMETKDR